MGLHLLPDEDGHTADVSCLCAPTNAEIPTRDGELRPAVVHHPLTGTEPNRECEVAD